MRDAGLEVSLHRGALPQATSVSLAAMLLGRLTSPTRAALRAELQLRLQEALNAMDPIDREILTLRHFEELNNDETAQVLGISKTAASNRYIRALKRLKDALAGMPGFFDSLISLAIDVRWSGERTTACPPNRAWTSRAPTEIPSSCWPRNSSSGSGGASDPSLAEYTSSYPELADEIRDLFPALVMMERLKPAGEELTRSRGGPARAARSDEIGRADRAAGRLPHPPRGRPRRHGGRLRGRAGVAGPARRAQGPARERAAQRRPRSSGSSARPARRRGCTTPTSCRSSASASTRASTTTPCSSSRATAWTRSSTTCGGCAALVAGTAAPCSRRWNADRDGRPDRLAWPWPARS